MQNTPMDLVPTLQIVAVTTATASVILWRKPIFGFLWQVIRTIFAIPLVLLQEALDVETRTIANERERSHEDQIRSMDAVVTALRDERRGWNQVHTALGKHIEDLQAQQRNRDERHNRLRREVENLGITARQLMDAAGGMTWKDRQGLVRGIVNLSDNHLETLLHAGWVNGEHADMVTQELERRNRDDQWHRKAGKTSPRETLVKLTEGETDKQAALDRGMPVHDEVAFDIETALGGLHIVPMGPIPEPIVTPPQTAVSPTGRIKMDDTLKKALQQGGALWGNPESDPLSAILEAKKKMDRAVSIPKYMNIDFSGLELRMVAQALLGTSKMANQMKTTGTTVGRIKATPRTMTRDEATDSPDVPYLTEREMELKEKGNYGIVPLTLNQRRAQAGQKVRIQDDPSSLRRFTRKQARVKAGLATPLASAMRLLIRKREDEMFRQLILSPFGLGMPAMMRPESMLANGGAIDFNGHNTGFQSGGLTPKTHLDFTAYGRGAK